MGWEPRIEGGPHGLHRLPRGRGSTTSPGGSPKSPSCAAGAGCGPGAAVRGAPLPSRGPCPRQHHGAGHPRPSAGFFSPKSCQEAAVVLIHPAPSAGRNLAPLGAKAASPSPRRAAGGGHCVPLAPAGTTSRPHHAAPPSPQTHLQHRFGSGVHGEDVCHAVPPQAGHVLRVWKQERGVRGGPPARAAPPSPQHSPQPSSPAPGDAGRPGLGEKYPKWVAQSPQDGPNPGAGWNPSQVSAPL